ncbi:MAG: Holliday junction resolvase RuvX [Chloroflexi bacterium]|nr:Holliday junction resolvase RuvX [Chloroflexota bacterium]
MRVMALDVGERRIGVGVSDESSLLARPVAVLIRTTKARDLPKIASLAQELEVQRIVIGLPLLMGGEAGQQARRTQRFAADLQQHIDIPITFWDERQSSQTAQDIMRQQGLGPTRRRQREDAVAAAVFLQDYLDYMNNSTDTNQTDIREIRNW